MTGSKALPLDRCALFLDFDGALTPLAPTPHAVIANPSVTELLRQAHWKLQGRLAVVSGRSLDDLDRLLEAASPSLVGSGGLQRRSEGRWVEEDEPHPMLEDATDVLRAMASAQPGLLVEAKPHCTAVHYRLAPSAEHAIVDCVERLAKATGLACQSGNMVIELRTPGPDRGQSVHAFMEERSFKNSTPIYIGDDLSDEPAFECVAELGGYGVLVGEARKTAAKFSLPSPPRVLDWISTSMDRECFDTAALHSLGPR